MLTCLPIGLAAGGAWKLPGSPSYFPARQPGAAESGCGHALVLFCPLTRVPD